MKTKSKIEWTLNPMTEGCGDTLNPWKGCKKVSSGCVNCYAERIAHQNFLRGDSRYGKVITRKGNWNGKFSPAFDQLQKAISRTIPTTYFMASMTDFGHPEVFDDWRTIALAVCSLCSGKYRNHTFQILTKHPNNLNNYFKYLGELSQSERLDLFVTAIKEKQDEGILRFPKWVNRKGGIKRLIDPRWPLSNVWVGTSVENQSVCDRIEYLKQIPAVVRFLSCEPLLTSLVLPNLNGIHWVIVGGESGKNARPCHLAWIRGIVRQCRQQEISVFVKQLGSRPIIGLDNHPFKVHKTWGDTKHSNWEYFPTDLKVREFPKMN